MAKTIINNEGEIRLKRIINGKNVLFITTKNIDYIRNSQEIKILNESASMVRILGYSDKNYFRRVAKIFLKMFGIHQRKYDLIFIGFAPQLILPFWYFKFRNKAIVIDFFISLYDTFVQDRKKCKEKSLLAKLLIKLDKVTLSKANFIISDTKAHGKYFVEDLDADCNKIIPLYLEADCNIYYPRNVIKPHKILNRYVVLYFGSI